MTPPCTRAIGRPILTGQGIGTKLERVLSIERARRYTLRAVGPKLLRPRLHHAAAGNRHATPTKLPVLTTANSVEFPQWHLYFNRVFRRPVVHPVDLHRFNFFYHHSQLGRLRAVKAYWNRSPGVLVNQPWVFPEQRHALSSIGAFVRRLEPFELPNDGRLRVMRKNVKGLQIEEKELTWFYLTRGSGIFVNHRSSNALIAKVSTQI